MAIVLTGTRVLRKIIDRAVNHDVGRSKKMTRDKFARVRKKLGKEELKRRYLAAKELNIKHGISPAKYRWKRQLPLGAHPANSKARVTLATKVTFLDT